MRGSDAEDSSCQAGGGPPPSQPPSRAPFAILTIPISLHKVPRLLSTRPALARQPELICAAKPSLCAFHTWFVGTGSFHGRITQRAGPCSRLACNPRRRWSVSTCCWAAPPLRHGNRATRCRQAEGAAASAGLEIGFCRHALVPPPEQLCQAKQPCKGAFCSLMQALPMLPRLHTLCAVPVLCPHR